MKAYWSNEMEESRGEILILSIAKSILIRTGNSRIGSNAEFENELLIAVNKAAQDRLFERLKWSVTENQYEELKEDIALEPDFFGNEYYAKLNAGLFNSKIDLNGIVVSRNMALVENLLDEVEIDNPSIDPWNDEYIAKLLADIEFALAEETLARKHLQY